MPEVLAQSWLNLHPSYAGHKSWDEADISEEKRLLAQKSSKQGLGPKAPEKAPISPEKA